MGRSQPDVGRTLKKLEQNLDILAVGPRELALRRAVGEISTLQLMARLGNFPYTDGQSDPSLLGSGYLPGTWDEVRGLRRDGLISSAEWEELFEQRFGFAERPGNLVLPGDPSQQEEATASRHGGEHFVVVDPDLPQDRETGVRLVSGTPVVVDPDPMFVESLLASMPPGSHGVESVDRLNAWLSAHTDAYAVVLGPSLTGEESVTTCEALRAGAPTISTILVRESMDTDLLTYAMKAGARDVVQYTDTPALIEAMERAYHLFVALRGPAGAMHMSKVISVFSPKGGVGKTTLSVNLALALTAKGARRVCLVDLDLAFGDVAITMQLFPTHSIEQAIGSEDTMDVEMLDGLLTRHQDSLMVLAAPPHPDTRERVSPRLVSRIIRTLRETFDYVVIDMAPSFDEQVLTALDETDEVVLVAALDVPTLKNVKVAVETLDALHIAKDNRHLVLNRTDHEVGINADKVEGILGMTVDAQIPYSPEVIASTNEGQPAVLAYPAHELSRAIRHLVGQLTGDTTARGVDKAPAGNGELSTWPGESTQKSSLSGKRRSG